MPDKAKARDIGTAVKLKPLGQTNRRLVEGAHRVKHGCGLVLLDELALNGRGDDARADRLGQQQDIAHARAAVGKHTVERDKAAHGQAVLGLVVVDGVATRDGTASLDALVGAARQDLPSNLNAHAIGNAQQVHGMARPPTHGVDVRKRVGRGDLSEHIWIIYDRSKEINRLNHRNIICHFVDGSIIGSLDSYY